VFTIADDKSSTSSSALGSPDLVRKGKRVEVLQSHLAFRILLGDSKR